MVDIIAPIENAHPASALSKDYNSLRHQTQIHYTPCSHGCLKLAMHERATHVRPGLRLAMDGSRQDVIVQL
jgi:hypothetical protein